MFGSYERPDRVTNQKPASSERSSEIFRETTRAPFETTVRLQFDSFGDVRIGYTANVSHGGLFVGCVETRPVGTILKFQLDLGPSQEPIEGMAEVVWIRLKQRDLNRPAGMGIQFRYLTDDSRERLDRALRAAIDAHQVPEEPEASAVAVAERASRLRHEIEQALASCSDLSGALDCNR